MRADLADWLRWLGRRTPRRAAFAAANSWSDFHAIRQEDKSRVRSHALLLPSKELLLALPLLLLAYEVRVRARARARARVRVRVRVRVN